MKQPDLSLVVPAYNEAHRIGPTLAALEQYCKRELKDLDTEIVVVVATGTDNTAELVRKFQRRMKRVVLIEPGKKVGKGRDVRSGMLAASGKYRLFMDADLATPIKYTRTFYELGKKNHDIVIAVRDLSSSHTGWRKFVSKAGNLLIQGLILPGISDSQCGFKLFNERAAIECFSRQTIMGWGFDMEILRIAKTHGFKIATVPVPDWSDKPLGAFDQQVVGAAFNTLPDLIHTWKNHLLRRYK